MPKASAYQSVGRQLGGYKRSLLKASSYSTAISEREKQYKSKISTIEQDESNRQAGFAVIAQTASLVGKYAEYEKGIIRDKEDREWRMEILKKNQEFQNDLMRGLGLTSTTKESASDILDVIGGKIVRKGEGKTLGYGRGELSDIGIKPFHGDKNIPSISQGVLDKSDVVSTTLYDQLLSDRPPLLTHGRTKQINNSLDNLLYRYNE